MGAVSILFPELNMIVMMLMTRIKYIHIYFVRTRLRWPRSQSGHYGEEINLFPLSVIEPRSLQPVA